MNERSNYSQAALNVHEDEQVDPTILVRRVTEHANTEVPIDFQEFESESFHEAENVDNSPHTSPANTQQQEMEENFRFHENERYEQSNFSETASLQSMLFSQQETIITPGDSTWFCTEEEEEKREKNVKSTITFTPAKIENMKRPRSAPPRKLTEMEEFRASNEFLNIQSVANSAGDLILKCKGKFDLDTVDGYNNCKSYLNQIEALMISFKVKNASRKYRTKFSKAYKVLYKEGSLCFLPEILDSAQEGFPYILVNGEKYIFSSNVLKAGDNLVMSFVHLKEYFQEIYNRYCILH